MNFTPYKRYTDHKAKAKQRGVDFKLTFDEWWDIWQKSGHWNERGRGKGKYCMSRIGDVGPYSTDNVIIQLSTQNSVESMLGRKLSTETIEKLKNKRSGENNPMYGKKQNFDKLECPHCKRQIVITNFNRWHNDNCKEKT